MKSWRTTTCGILTLIASAIPLIVALIDGDPATAVDMQELGAIAMGVAAFFGFTVARDNKVSSEDAGAK